MHGIKLGRLTSIEVLNLRANHLTPRFLASFKDTFDSGVLLSLRVLDLRDNELGDEGADTIMCMIIADYFLHIEELWLQNNNITDKGFRKIVTAIRSLHERKCPSLKRLGLEGNPISADIKREFSPLHSCISA